jgi:hypothetical protein
MWQSLKGFTALQEADYERSARHQRRIAGDSDVGIKMADLGYRYRHWPGAAGAGSAVNPHLYYFRPVEFGEWWQMMDPRLLVLLDSLRHQWGKPIRISADDAAIGRNLGGSSLSQHNADKWGVVRAVDVFPEMLTSSFDAEDFVDLATRVGFTGIGVYPHWTGGIGVHLDTRVDAEPGNPAKWGAVNNAMGKQRYVALSEALEVIS